MEPARPKAPAHVVIVKNAEPGSFDYYHEQKHVQDADRLARLELVQPLVLSWLLLSVFYSAPGNPLAGFAWLSSMGATGLVIAMWLIPELRADFYAAKMVGWKKMFWRG